MPALDNPRHEQFCQAIASGMKGAPAYRKVYGDVKSARCQASSLLKDPDISKRVGELTAKGVTSAVMTLQEKLEYLTKAIITPLDQIDESNPLCQRAKYSENGRELWMVDKLRALELLSRLMGEFAAVEVKVEHGGTVHHHHTITEEERQTLMQRHLQALGSN